MNKETAARSSLNILNAKFEGYDLVERDHLQYARVKCSFNMLLGSHADHKDLWVRQYLNGDRESLWRRDTFEVWSNPMLPILEGPSPATLPFFPGPGRIFLQPNVQHHGIPDNTSIGSMSTSAFSQESQAYEAILYGPVVSGNSVHCGLDPLALESAGVEPPKTTIHSTLNNGYLLDQHYSAIDPPISINIAPGYGVSEELQQFPVCLQ